MGFGGLGKRAEGLGHEVDRSNPAVAQMFLVLQVSSRAMITYIYLGYSGFYGIKGSDSILGYG